MKKHALKTVDAETLLSTPLRPVHFLVDRLIPPGLHLFCGSPKVGKSWLMLWLCLKVSQGEPLWEYQTRKCQVLYLCLEDNISRVQSRLFHITDAAPPALHFAVAAQNITNGLMAQIEDFLSSHPDTGLVVIDTLQRIRGLSSDNSAYASDYRDIGVLKQVADKHRLALVLVHHLRKMDDSDPLHKISGTTGLTGAVDGTYVLERAGRADNTAKLHITGRDVEYQELTLKFDDCIWQFVSCERSEEIRRRETPAFLFRVVELLQEHGNWSGSASGLLQALDDVNTPPNTVTKLLNQYHTTFLAESGIHYSFNRTSKARLIKLERVADKSMPPKIGDGCDSCDGYSAIEKKPSLPSPTVT
ncbi:helicase RepA family protein [Christensenellaceae bacterium OttesenSCG-928-K19]|nr:helicase RepA family protein [Christensenellaceae bacterium OttesenSCG-928-K19]